MRLDNATELISGANRGLGPVFAPEALARATRRVYAGVRDPSKLTLAGGEAIERAVTRPADARRRWLKIA
jgi:NAD(P)-dependent dehydrogenase (short-subunit alcohol dehydrogenase family)